MGSHRYTHLKKAKTKQKVLLRPDNAAVWPFTADWWKSMKQLLPSKMVETEDSVRYSSSEVCRLAARGAVPRLHAEPAGGRRSEMLLRAS